MSMFPEPVDTSWLEDRVAELETENRELREHVDEIWKMLASLVRDDGSELAHDIPKIGHGYFSDRGWVSDK